MATGDLVSGSDGYTVIKVGPWAKEKLFYIRRYCYIFNVGMKDKWLTRTYIDLFSGPGKCLVETTKEEIAGSALTALECEVPFTHYLFNDLNAHEIEALRARTVGFTSSFSIRYFNSDCNQAIEHILKELPSKSLDFCFIDPTNWQIKFSTIQRLTKDRRMDLAITFHTGAIKRVINNPPPELDDFFGDPDWRYKYNRAQASGRTEVGRILLDIYEQRLKSLGYIEPHDYILMKNSKGVPLYHLIFASKHHRGKDFWVRISQRDADGQIRMPLTS